MKELEKFFEEVYKKAHFYEIIAEELRIQLNHVLTTCPGDEELGENGCPEGINKLVNQVRNRSYRRTPVVLDKKQKDGSNFVVNRAIPSKETNLEDNNGFCDRETFINTCERLDFTDITNARNDLAKGTPLRLCKKYINDAYGEDGWSLSKNDTREDILQSDEHQRAGSTLRK